MSSPYETPVRVLIVDDHTLFAEGTVSLFRAEPRISAVGIAKDGGECLALLRETAPDVLLLDIGLPDINGTDLIGQIKSAAPRVKILMLTGLNPREFIRKSMSRGASGFLIKECTTGEMIEAILTVYEGGVYLSERLEAYLGGESNSQVTAGLGGTQPGLLTPREVEILDFVAKGLRSKEIASTLNINTKTVEFHIGNILRKLGANTRWEAAVKWETLGEKKAEVGNLDFMTDKL